MPDKLFREPCQRNDLVENYGLEEGADAIQGGVLWGPESYFLSNRHGDFTYRIDFSDRAPKIVAVDMLEMWHDHPGSRPIRIDVAFDSRWFRAFDRFDPATWAVMTPLTINLYPGSAHTFRIRMSTAPGAADIPFANGIRVSRVR